MPAEDGALTMGRRWSIYCHSLFNWPQALILGVDSAKDYGMGNPKEWGRDPPSYAARYASSFGRRFVRKSIEFGVSAAINQDPRYQPSGLHGLRARAKYAVLHAFLAKKPDGSYSPAYARMAGTAGAAAIVPIWYPNSMNAGRVFSDIGFSTADYCSTALLVEFQDDLKRFGRKIFRKIIRK